MDAAGLDAGFQVGDWLVEPRALRASSGGNAVALTDDQLQLLIALAARHGESVDRRALRHQLWPAEPGAEERLRATLASLRALFGDTPRHRRYIASVGHDGLALIAHFEPFTPAPAVSEPRAADAPLGRRLHWLLGELRRRSVLKVAASYLLGMWIVLQVAQVTFAPLRFPDWWMTALTIIAIIGLPIVVVLAWTYDITAEGIVVDPGADGLGAVKLARPRPRQSLAPFIVAGVALMACVTGFAWWRSLEQRPAVVLAGDTAADETPGASQAGAESIAVLPLVDMSAAGGNGWLGDGLSEELSTRLAQVPGLRVAARTSAFGFRDRNVDVRRIGQSLGVRHVIEGSVRREGDHVRVTVQLIDTTSGFHVWAGSFDRAWRDVLSLQNEIARSVAEALQLVLLSRQGPAARGGSAVLDTRVIEPYLEGLALLRQPGDLTVLQRAERAFRSATAVTPEFAGAHAGLCSVLVRRFDQTRDRDALEQAQDACRQALELDPSLIDTEKALAGLSLANGDYQQAIDAYRQVLARNPRDADAHVAVGEALAGLGRAGEAEASLREAVAVDPSYWGAHTALGQFLFQRGRVEEAIAALRTATQLVPSSAAAWSNLGGAMQLHGDFAGAGEAYERSLRLEPSKNAYSNVATIQFSTGDFAGAVRNYERAVALGEHDHVVRGNLADALWQLPDRRADAVAAYRKAIELAEAERASTPDDPTLLAQLGYYYGRAGDPARSQAYLAEASGRGADLLYVQYYRAVAATDRGDRATALAAVSRLVALGYPPVLLRSAPEFRSLLQDAEYRNLLATTDRSRIANQGGP